MFTSSECNEWGLSERGSFFCFTISFECNEQGSSNEFWLLITQRNHWTVPTTKKIIIVLTTVADFKLNKLWGIANKK